MRFNCNFKEKNFVLAKVQHFYALGCGSESGHIADLKSQIRTKVVRIRNTGNSNSIHHFSGAGGVPVVVAPVSTAAALKLMFNKGRLLKMPQTVNSFMQLEEKNACYTV
jgi:hypothetical protein